MCWKAEGVDMAKPAWMQTEAMLDARIARRQAAEHRHLVRLEKLEALAAPMVGELCREGRTVYYCYPAGGRYFESPSESAVIDYLIRNRWVQLH